MDISTNTLVLAMMAVARDILRMKAEIEGLTDQDEIDEESQRLFELQVALSELDSIYEDQRVEYPDLRPANDWLPPLP